MSNVRRGRIKMACIILAVQTGKENIQSNNSTRNEKKKKKTKWLKIMCSLSLRR